MEQFMLNKGFTKGYDRGNLTVWYSQSHVGYAKINMTVALRLNGKCRVTAQVILNKKLKMYAWTVYLSDEQELREYLK